MTDKQIMIDGIDVSGCKYYVQNNGVEAQGCYELTDICECNEQDEFCCDNKNCYYKQLQAKEQKLEKIKKYVEDNEWCILDDTYKELIQIIEDKQNDR